MLSEYIRKKFINLFNTNPLLVRSPGRINLFGDLSSDQHGFLITAAIDKEIFCAISPNYSDICQVHAYNFRDTEVFHIGKFKKSEKHWMNLIHSVVDQFQKRKLEIKGFDCVFGGDIPVGAGLDASAAISNAFTYSLNLLYEHKLSKPEIVAISQSAKKDYMGQDYGIMDPLAGVFGKTNQVILLEGNNMGFEYFSFPFQEYRLVLCDTGVRNDDALTARVDHNSENIKVTYILKKQDKSIQSLRDVSLEQLSRHEAEFDPELYRRYKFLVEENTRITECCEMLKRDDLPGFGQNMYKSHEGLRLAYKMSCKEVDFLEEKIRTSGLCIGSKLMGFSGSIISIVRVEKVDAFIKFASEAFNAEYDRQLKTYTLKIENGTSKL